MSRLWITRTQPAASRTALELRARDHGVCVAPLIKAEFNPDIPGPPGDACLIFTSRNGVQAFSRAVPDRHWLCLCVGDVTARMAKEAGFKQVVSAQGDATAVIERARALINPARPVCHITGSHPRGGIVENLRASGFDKAERVEAYSVTMMTVDPRPDKRHNDVVLLYSPMAAQAFMNLGLNTAGMSFISLSRAIDKVLGDIKCVSRKIAEAPNEKALFVHLP